MIAIINKKVKNREGDTLYYVQINDMKVSEFWHKREDGLETCLKKASQSTPSQRELENLTFNFKLDNLLTRLYD